MQPSTTLLEAGYWAVVGEECAEVVVGSGWNCDRGGFVVFSTFTCGGCVMSDWVSLVAWLAASAAFLYLSILVLLPAVE
jgi:hypothetical protein